MANICISATSIVTTGKPIVLSFARTTLFIFVILKYRKHDKKIANTDNVVTDTFIHSLICLVRTVTATHVNRKHMLTHKQTLNFTHVFVKKHHTLKTSIDISMADIKC